MNKLSLNASKTKYMVFRDTQRKLRDGDETKFKINESKIERVQEFSFSGSTINEHMTWCSHIRTISNKIWWWE